MSDGGGLGRVAVEDDRVAGRSPSRGDGPAEPPADWLVAGTDDTRDVRPALELRLEPVQGWALVSDPGLAYDELGGRDDAGCEPPARGPGAHGDRVVGGQALDKLQPEGQTIAETGGGNGEGREGGQPEQQRDRLPRREIRDPLAPLPHGQRPLP